MALKLRNIEIGAGIPKICVPVTGNTKEKLLAQVREAKKSVAALVEIRIDYFVKENGMEEVLKILDEIRTILGETVILFTFRTLNEGGECDIQKEDYEKLMLDVAQKSDVDLIDVEINLGEAFVEKLIRSIHSYGKKVIASNHDFEKTVSVEEMLKRMKMMQKIDADIAKIAMMPNKKEDVISVFSATIEGTRLLNIPLVTMSMGKLGNITRICGEFSGSAITFATSGEASAPGQMNAARVYECLDVLN